MKTMAEVVEALAKRNYEARSSLRWDKCPEHIRHGWIIDAQATVDFLTAAGFGPVKAAQAEALRGAAEDFEDNIGVGEFDELSRSDGKHWTHIEDAWEHQGPYMDWLRARAATMEGGT